jgi:NitT/TauT family transport system substrate-binding protein
MMRQRKQYLWIILVLGVALALVGGCRQGQPESAPVLIGVRTSNCQSPFYLADRLGLYEEAGVNVDVQLILSNTAIIEAAQRKDLQMGSLPITTAIAAISQGTDIVIVSGTGRGSDGILTRASDGYSTLGDLQGKKIATIRGSILDVPLRMALEQEGIDPEQDVTLVYFNKLGDMISALKTGQVDAASNTEPFMTEAVRDGWGHVLTYYTAQWPDHPCCIVFAQRGFAGEHSEELVKVLQAHLKAVEYANTHQKENAANIVEYLEAFDEELVCASLAPEKMRLDALLEVEDVIRMAKYMQQYGLIDNVPSTDRLVDLSYLKQALVEASK